MTTATVDAPATRRDDARQAPRPNVLLIVCDQLRADHVGFGGSRLVSTPNLDALAGRGRVFDRAYVANPICMPNRVSILTGLVPAAHGVTSNAGALAWSANTFVRMLRADGYRTALIGKADIQNGLRRLFEPEASGPTAMGDPYPQGWDAWEDLDRFLGDDIEDPDDFYGFERLALTLGHGDMVGGHHLRWALARGANLDDLQRWGPSHALEVSDHWWQVYKPALPEELYSSTFVTETAVDAIEDLGREGEPWFIECSYPDPHHPFTAPGRWFDRHHPDEVELPPTFDDDLSKAPGHYQHFRDLNHSRHLVQMFGPAPDELRAAAAAEAGAIELIDHGIGQLLAALERTAQADRTVVIFTSDHGDAFGDHGLMLKGMMQWSGCLRIPLVVAGPGVGDPGRTDALASTIDLAPTVLALTGTATYDGLQGTNLTPVLDNPASAVRDVVYIEEDFPQAGVFPFPVPHRARTIVTSDARLSRYVGTGEGELYDLADDPLERANRWADESHAARRAQLVDRLVDEMATHAESPRLGSPVG
jgi:arylsulfatase A-like enzyme